MRRTSWRGARMLATCLQAIVWFSLTVVFASAQIVAEDERNVSEMEDFQNECAIAINPSNRNELFVACNKAGPGLFFARSIDRGHSWIYPDQDKAIADGDADQGPPACCDPSAAWDSFGNLYVTYLMNDIANPDNITGVETLLSTDGGQTFQHLWKIGGSVDQPTVVAANISDPNPRVALWIVWNASNNMYAIGVPVMGRGRANIGNNGAFPLFAEEIPDTIGCSFGDVAIAPDGTVVQVCQAPAASLENGHIQTNVDPDGLGPLGFGPRIVPDIDTKVGGFDSIPAQASNAIDAAAGLAFDRNPGSPHFGRLYLVYTDEVVDEQNDTDIMLRFSDDISRGWDPTIIRVNDDPAPPIRSQFLPRISTNPITGNIMVCWHDSRNSAYNNEMQEFCAVSTPTPSIPSFFPNRQVGAGTSSGTGSLSAGDHDVQYGDYSGLDYFGGRAHPVWADQSNVTGDNPDGTITWDAQSSRVGSGPMASEGVPHITTVDGTRYDFQADAEFVAARSADGFEVQVRHAAIPTTNFPGRNPHAGLSTCVSINSAVAARVGAHRVTYQQGATASSGPAQMELRIDGELTALTDNGVELSGGGRVLRSAVGGIEVEFPNGALLTATPGFWGALGKWYLNLNITDADAYEGIMGALPADSWLPTLPDGSSLSAMPTAAAERNDVLYRRFAKAWQVGENDSLFDYDPTQPPEGAAWPKDSAPCNLPHQMSATPTQESVAKQACSRLAYDARRENCIFDVAVTGEAGFADTYLKTERLQQWGTTTILSAESKKEETATVRYFVATPVARWPSTRETPAGSVQFYLGGETAGELVMLDGNGRATWLPDGDFDWANYQVTARYIPANDNAFLTSLSGKGGTPR